MTETRHIMAKVVLVGDKAVGKTSLIRRYVVDQFDDRYLLTLGTKVTKKVVEVDVPEKDLHVSLDMNIWDIMGQVGFRELAKEAYFLGARGLIAVMDLTRKDTLETIGAWIKAVQDVTGPVPKVLVANKRDLADQAAFGQTQVGEAAARFGCPYLLTSAKTGDNVEAVFRRIGTDLVHSYITG